MIHAAAFALLLISICASDEVKTGAQAITSNASDLAATHQSRSLHADKPFPPYERGKDKYQFVLTETERMNGMSYLGAKSRLRAAVNKLKKGEPFKAGYVGGSITGGQGAVDAPNWPQYVTNWLEDSFGGKSKATGQNGAVGGTLSSYMSVCHNLHIPKDADIVFVEYSVNDWHSPGGPPFQNNIRRAFERLLRKIMRYPNKPAVVLLNAYIWFLAYPFPGSFCSNSEREFSEFGLFYHLPTISLKAAVYQKLAAGEPGFLITDTRNKNPDGLKEKAFYWDPIHPDGKTGARVMAELAIHLIDSTLKELEMRKGVTG